MCCCSGPKWPLATTEIEQILKWPLLCPFAFRPLMMMYHHMLSAYHALVCSWRLREDPCALSAVSLLVSHPLSLWLPDVLCLLLPQAYNCLLASNELARSSTICMYAEVSCLPSDVVAWTCTRSRAARTARVRRAPPPSRIPPCVLAPLTSDTHCGGGGGRGQPSASKACAGI